MFGDDEDDPMVTDEYGFRHRQSEPVTLEEAVFVSLGAASSCWSDLSGAGEFDSTRAKAIGENLVRFIEARMAKEAAF